MKYLSEAIARAKNVDSTERAFKIRETGITDEDRLYQDALAKVNAKRNVMEAEDEQGIDASDKGMFGGRQVRFKEEVYKMPQNPTGDASQPIGILTKSDLNNYVLFRKDDRLSFKYKEGTSGACCYEATRHGSGEEVDCCEWSDALIQELIDEGAMELI